MSQSQPCPFQGSKLAAGYDLYSAYDYTIPASGKMLVKTDIQVSACYAIVEIMGRVLSKVPRILDWE